MKQFFTLSIGSIAGLVGYPQAAHAQAPALTTQQPARNAVAAPRTGALTLTFTQAITAATAPQAARIWQLGARAAARHAERHGRGPDFS